MAYEAQQIRHSFVAGEDLSGDQYALVYIGSDGLIYNDSNSEARKAIGVVQDNPKTGVAGLVTLLGLTKLKVAGAVAAGDTVTGNTGTTVGIVVEGTSGAGNATVFLFGADAAVGPTGPTGPTGATGVTGATGPT